MKKGTAADKQSVVLSDVVALLRDNYWYLETTGAKAMANLWAELADNRSGFEETAREVGIDPTDFVAAASLLGEWFRANDLLYKSPLEMATEIRGEKLHLPEGPR